jgi:hypothetical protein
MKQMIILLSMIILGIAISAMVLSFNAPTQTITNNTQTKIAEQLTL